MLYEMSLFLVFLRNGKAHLFTVVTAFVIELLQWITHRFVIFLAIAEYVDSQIYSLSERILVGHIFPCFIISSAVGRRGAYNRQTSGKVDTVVLSDGLRRSQRLIMIHSQNAVKFLITVVTEESVGRVGTESLYAIFCQF